MTPGVPTEVQPAGNAFEGDYAEKVQAITIGAWSEQEYAALPEETRTIIEDIATGKRGDKTYKCVSSTHPLRGAYEQARDLANQSIQLQLSEPRILTDLHAYMEGLHATGKLKPKRKKQWKDTLAAAVMQAVGARLLKIRRNAETVFHEAVMNIIEHGMQHDPRKTGFATVGMNANGNFDMTTYCETAFNYRAAVDAALDPANLEKESGGRGILYITSFPDEHRFSEGGRCLLMRFLVREELRQAFFAQADKLAIDIPADERKNGVENYLGM